MTPDDKVDWKPYQTEVLFVLVGENPLPNLVAVRLLRPKTLYLVHSKDPGGTGAIARRLARHLQEYNAQPVAVNQHSVSALRTTLEGCLACMPAGKVGLNYTGGTKFMAVHTYQAIEEHCRDQQLGVVLSYLHADTLELSIEHRPGVPRLRRSVVDEVPLCFEDVFALHGLELRGKLETEPQQPALARALALMNSSEEGVEAWRTCRALLLQPSHPSWVQVRADMHHLGTPDDVLSQLERALHLEDTQPVNLGLAARRAGFGKYGSLRTWLNGGWLEDWTLACIRNLDGHYPCLRNLSGWIPGETDQDPTNNFEIDVAAMRGYQLFALSCKAVKRRKEAKLGLMEAFARARQMGGEEARAALVTTRLDADSLKHEFASDWGAGKRVRVFGCEQLPELEGLLAGWFQNP